MAATIAWKPLYFLLPFLLPFLAYSTGRPIIEGAGLEQGCGVGSGGSNHCLYTLRVQTGNRVNAGTDSKISVTLAGPDHVRYHVPNLESWGGLMWDGYNYFERGYADAFAGCGTCITWPPCWIRLTSDGSGSHPGWFVDFVELWAAGPDSQCTKHRFDFHVIIPFSLIKNDPTIYTSMPGAHHSDHSFIFALYISFPLSFPPQILKNGYPFPFLVLLFLLLGSSLVHSTAAASLIEAVGSDRSVWAGTTRTTCVYTLYVRTGRSGRGHGSVIGVELTGSDGPGSDHEPGRGGADGEGHNYFERATSTCSAGSGLHFVAALPAEPDVGRQRGPPRVVLQLRGGATTGPTPACAQQLFTVEQWLRTDTSPTALRPPRQLRRLAAGEGEDTELPTAGLI
ncbi:hypothetical protein ACMD2_00171 [Ananas comosus]|uniref:PLAT domain-containing protein n=1 Tax=Ananas comosus TaxID=4615 RepID=A0A199VQB4_ANACO|nr:hypothetical protein ACMD2_00171 [Ananas comosus]